MTEQMRRFFYVGYGEAGLLPRSAALCPERRIARRRKPGENGRAHAGQALFLASCTPMPFVAVRQ